ncbi:hypothetical protein [Microseira wollei]|uniref:Transposase n=1 Tax=Microseira wollei NIES-4236 TaxID=2530354 RepID=A0AAV3WZ98_9CYAN|nr:hypothetical protein [Microseira wollei]GET35702.1 hypothetical protein MiSe_04450 [Microseira wollei NIES-4236]
MSEHRLDKIVFERPRERTRFKYPPGYKKNIQKSDDDLRADMAELEELSRQQARNARQLYESNQYESMRRPWQSHAHNCVGKQDFSKNLAPLRRWLFSKVGQHWDDIYSELCQRIDKRTTTGQRLFSHVWDLVERDVVLIDGVLYSKSNREYHFANGRWRRLRKQVYVHPDTGILCFVEKPPREPKPAKEDDRLVIDKYHKYCKLNDLWYLVTFQDIPPNEEAMNFLWVEYEKNPKSGWKATKVAVSKRQCNKQQIKYIMKQLNLN